MILDIVVELEDGSIADIEVQKIGYAFPGQRSAPELIMKLLKVYPEFEALYQEVYELCRNTEEVIRMFSKELAELDRNTVRYMIDEMQDTIKEQQDTIDKQHRQLVEKEKEIEELRKLLEHEKGRNESSCQ